MTDHEILQIAMQQSAIDSNCRAEDFMSSVNKVVLSGTHPQARKYLKLPFYCDLTSYGNNIVASAVPEITGEVAAYLDRYPVEHCFETPHLHVLHELLVKRGMAVCFMAEYFLPEMKRLQPLDCAYELRLLTPEQFADYYLPEWENALSGRRKQLDVLAVGAFDGERLIGLAGCSADCETMWQIGVDVLPGYRRQGIASAVTSRLAAEILDRGIVPFYCCAWSNLKSVRNAFKSGFKPAWVQLTAKSMDQVAEMNGVVSG